MTARAERQAGRQRRLFWKVYFHGILLLVLVIIAVAIMGRTGGHTPGHWRKVLSTFASHLGKQQPDGMRRELEAAQQRFGLQGTIYSTDGQLIISTAQPAIRPIPGDKLHRIRTEPTFFRGRLATALQRDGKQVAYLLVKFPKHEEILGHILTVLVVVLLVLAVGSIPLVRAIVSPLEKLTATARRLGTGDLTARARIRRRDEIGELGHAFDEMASRIDRMMRSERELLANVSHELRTPLARIRVALELANEGEQEQARRYLAEIGTDLAELETLIEDVLTAARLDLAADGDGATPLRKGRVGAASLVARAAERFRSTHPSHPLDVTIGDPLPELQADGVLLRRVIDNLLDNARKYSDDGKTIAREASATTAGLAVVVRDAGIGIEAEELPHLFEPFYRTDRSRGRDSGGVGLGLTLARRIVEAHGGSISAASKSGRGTTISFVIPLQDS